MKSYLLAAVTFVLTVVFSQYCSIETTIVLGGLPISKGKQRRSGWEGEGRGGGQKEGGEPVVRMQYMKELIN